MQWAYDQGKITVSASGVTNVSGDAQELLDLDGSECRITWSNSVFGMKSAKGSGYPCVEVSWYGAAAYCNYRSELDGKTPCYDLSDWSVDITATGYRLPSNEEWEYAARGGLSGKRFPWGDTITHSNANYISSDSYSYDISPTRGYHPDYKNGGGPYSSPSETFAPNGYGLYDMAGNVWEWCNTLHASGSRRGNLGGSWRYYAPGLRCGREGWYYPDRSDHYMGFRAICAAPGPEMVTIPSGVNSGVDPDFGAYSLTNEVAFKMDKFEVTNDEMVRVMQWAYDQGKITVSASGVTNVSGDAQELLDLDDSDCRITWSNSVFGMKSAKGSGYPCVEVTWYGAAAYCNYRSELEGKTPCYDLSDWSVDVSATGYRLPSSDEWEYAARGGLSGKRFPWGDTITHSNANYYSSSSYSYDISPTREYHPDYKDGGYPYTSPSETFAPNGYGLHDMAGNVLEWCNTTSGSYRYVRGGSWDYNAIRLRCGYEGWHSPDNSLIFIGFRPVSR